MVAIGYEIGKCPFSPELPIQGTVFSPSIDSAYLRCRRSFLQHPWMPSNSGRKDPNMWWHALPSVCIHSFLSAASETFGCLAADPHAETSCSM